MRCLLEIILLGILGLGGVDDEKIIRQEFSHHKIFLILVVEPGLERKVIIMQVLESFTFQNQIELVLVQLGRMRVVSPNQRQLVTDFYITTLQPRRAFLARFKYSKMPLLTHSSESSSIYY